MAAASVTGIPVLAIPPEWLCASLLGTPKATMREKLAGGGPKLFTPWMTMEEELAGAGATQG